MFTDRLRFPIKSLTILIDNTWKPMKKLKASHRSEINNPEILTLDDVLLDTGNETNYCSLAKNFLASFKQSFKNVETRKSVIGNVAGKNLYVDVTKDKFEFRFYHVRFFSKLGFIEDPFGNWLRTINIGMNSIKQFTNIIANSHSNNYYYCLMDLL